MKLVKPRFCGFTMLVEAENGFMASFTIEAGPKNLFGRASAEAGARAAFEAFQNTPLVL
jgi:hypothetical protein